MSRVGLHTRCQTTLNQAAGRHDYDLTRREMIREKYYELIREYIDHILASIVKDNVAFVISVTLTKSDDNNDGDKNRCKKTLVPRKPMSTISYIMFLLQRRVGTCFARNRYCNILKRLRRTFDSFTFGENVRGTREDEKKRE